MHEKNTIICTGGSGLLFTDENGKTYLIDCPKLASGERILFSSRIKQICSDKEMSEKEREIIVSKVLELTPETKWRILK